MIISGGENIYPAEVESALNSLPGITRKRGHRRALLPAGAKSARRSSSAAALGDWNPDTIREALALKLASYKIPKYVQHVPSLPKTATGKVRKHDLSQLIKETADGNHR